MKNKGFTITEIVVMLLILSILASIGMASWDKMIDTANQRVCAQNQILLIDALSMYIQDNEATPTSLSGVSPCYVDTAIAKLKKDKPLTYCARKIYLAIIEYNDRKYAWAIPAFKNYIGANRSILTCPANKSGGISYGINSKLMGLTGSNAYTVFKGIKGNNEPIICDCDKSAFNTIAESTISDAAFRHSKRFFPAENVAVAVGGNNEAVAISTSVKDFRKPRYKILKRSNQIFQDNSD